MQFAIYMNMKFVVSKLLEHPFININICDFDGNNILHIAIGAMNITSTRRYSMLYTLFASNKRKEISKLINNQNNYGQTPIMLALSSEHYNPETVSFIKNMIDYTSPKTSSGVS